MGVGGLGLGNGGWGFGPNPQSPIPNPQSPIPNPHILIKILYLFLILIKKIKNIIKHKLKFFYLIFKYIQILKSIND